MTNSEVCVKCGAPLPADAPKGFCPQCLIQVGLASEADLPTLISDSAPAAPPPVRSPRPGEMFGGYRILRPLGRGGMGSVFEADDTQSGRRVALKILDHKLNSAEARARFLREGRLAASVNHPNSVYVFGTEEIEDILAISMELVPGGARSKTAFNVVARCQSARRSIRSWT